MKTTTITRPSITTPQSVVVHRLIPSFALGAWLLALLPAAQAANYTWIGTSSSTWSNSANWVGGSYPGVGASGVNRLNVSNNLANLLIYNFPGQTTVFSNNVSGGRGLVIGSGGSSGSGSGAMIIQAGTISTVGSQGADIIGNTSGNTGSLTVDGGSYIATAAGTSMGIGGGPACLFTITNGGTATVATLNFNNTRGTLNLEQGGTLAANAITYTTGLCTNNFNGGTLKPRADSTTFLSNSALVSNVRNLGVTIDTTNFNITIGEALVHSTVGGDNATDGGLTKNGVGTLTLSGTSTYNGGTVITAGTLALGNATDTLLDSGAINVNGGTLDIGANTDTVGAVTLTSGSITGSGGTLTGSAYDVQSGTIAAILGGAGVVLNKTTSGTVTLSGANTYTGNTVISAGTLALGASGSLAANSSVSLAAGASFDVSALGSYSWGASAALTASGTGTTPGTDAAELIGTTDLGSQPVTLNLTPTSFAGDSTHPALYVSSGSLTLNSPITVNNLGASPLGNGTYVLIAQASGTISGTPYRSGLVGGNGIEAGKVANVQVSGGNVELVVQDAIATTSVLYRTNSTPASSTYGDVLDFGVSVTPAVATGTVELWDGGVGGTLIGSGTLSGGVCTITPAETALDVGNHTNIVALYLGDSTYGVSTSAALSPAQDVSVKALIVSGAAAQNKFYDGTTAAVVSGGSLTVGGGAGEVETGDTVTLSQLGTFASVGPGTGIAVTSSSILGGADASNYTVTEPGGLSADIYASPVWNGAAADTLWDTDANWVGGLAAVGANVTADFSTLNITSEQTVNLNSARTIGNLTFGDTDTNSAAGWTLANNGNAANNLTLAGSAPTVTVNALGGTARVTVSAVVAGTDGFTKSADGMLLLTGNNTYSGATAINAGTVVVQNNAALGSSAAGTTVAAGATLDLGGSLAANALNLGSEVVTVSGTGVGGNGALVHTGPNTQINALQQVRLAGNTTIGGSQRWDMRGGSSLLDMGTNTLTKTGSNYIALVGTTITNAGAIDIQQGTLGIQTSANIGGSAANTLTVQSGAAIENYQTANPQSWSLVLQDGSTFWAESGTGSHNTWAGPVTLNGAATFRADGVMTISNVISGASGSIIKIGAATATLTGNNTYGGITTVSNGTLIVNGDQSTATGAVTVLGGTTLGGAGSIGGAVTIQSGAVLTPGSAGVGTLTNTALTLSAGSTANFEITDAVTLDQVVVTASGGLTLNDVGFNLYQPGTTTPFSVNGTYTLFQYTGTLNGSLGSLIVLNSQPGKTYAFSADGANVQLTIGDAPTPIYWGLDADESWATAGNWSPAAVPNTQFAAASFGGPGSPVTFTAPHAVTLDGTYTLGALTFDTTQSFSLTEGSGGGLLLDNGAGLAMVTQTSGSHAVNVPVVLPVSGAAVSVATSTTLALDSPVSGSGGITKTAAGTLTLGGTNTYAGVTTISQGIVSVAANSALGSTAGGTILNGGNTTALQLANGVVVSGESVQISGYGVAAPTVARGALQAAASATAEWAGPVLLGSGDTRVGAQANGTLIISGVISNGSGNTLTASADPTGGKVIVSGTANTYTGQSQILRGTLQLGTHNALPVTTVLNVDSAASTGDNGTFEMNGYNQEVAGIIRALTGGNFFIKNSSVSLSTLTVNNATSDYTFPGTSSGATTIEGNLALIKSGSRKLTLDRPNTYTGNTTINAGTLALTGSGTVSATPVITVGSAGILDVAGVTGGFVLGASQTLAGSGAVVGNVTASGTLSAGTSIGTLTFSNNLIVNGNLVFELDKGQVQSNDFINVVGALSNTGAGILTVTSIGPALAINDSFKLFSQPLANGLALTIVGPDGVTFTNKLEEDGSIAVLSLAPSLPSTGTNITFSATSSNLTLSWPSEYTGWYLQSQTNALSTGLSSNWVTIDGSQNTNEVTLPINSTDPTVFFRMVHTNAP